MHMQYFLLFSRAKKPKVDGGLARWTGALPCALCPSRLRTRRRGATAAAVLRGAAEQGAHAARGQAVLAAGCLLHDERARAAALLPRL